MRRLALTAATAAFFLPTSLVLASDQRDVFVPASSAVRSQDLGTRVHSSHLIYTGTASPIEDSLGLPLAAHGPAALRTGPAGYHPSDIRQAYELPTSGGTGAIALVTAYHFPSALNDFNVFANQFRLPRESSSNPTASTNRVFQVVYQGSSQPKVDASWGQEAALDIEWAHAMAPNAKIYLVEANSSSADDMFAAAKKAASLKGVQQVSMSFGMNEFSSESRYDGYFNKSGVVFFAASGDQGGVRNYPAVSPNVVGVGGTSLRIDGDGSVSSETAWNSAGGGLSAYLDRPVAQNPLAAILGLKRGSPDVSFVADPSTGCAVYDSTPSGGFSGWMVIGGTSLGAPCIAGIANLSMRPANNSSFELARIYGSLGSDNFRDVTSGAAGSYTASAGWDFVTGVGSPVGTSAL